MLRSARGGDRGRQPNRRGNAVKRRGNARIVDVDAIYAHSKRLKFTHGCLQLVNCVNAMCCEGHRHGTKAACQPCHARGAVKIAYRLKQQDVSTAINQQLEILHLLVSGKRRVSIDRGREQQRSQGFCNAHGGCHVALPVLISLRQYGVGGNDIGSGLNIFAMQLRKRMRPQRGIPVWQRANAKGPSAQQLCASGPVSD